MSAARLGGAITAGLLGLVLVLLSFLSLGEESVVRPTVGFRPAQTGQMTGSAPRAPTTEQILAARTRLMDDRQETGEAAFPDLAMGNQTIVTDPNVPAADALVQNWQASRPSGDILRERGDVFGLSSLPYRNAEMLQQPGGRVWRRTHNDQVRYGGAWFVLGISFVIATFLAARGRVPLAEGWSGRTIGRFNALERANHWMTASSFLIMALTGLLLLYGKPLLLPLIGEGAFGRVAWWSVWLHMAATVPFVIGICLMAVLWIRDNLPTRLDWHWLKRGGGFLRDDGNNPPARRFNAGQKIVFWGVFVGGLAALLSGLTLMFPFYWFGFDGMQTAQTAHAVIGLLLVALIIGHIYIGTVGMEGAVDAMWSGQVDRNWAKEHHRLWYEKVTGDDERERPTVQSVPAE